VLSGVLTWRAGKSAGRGPLLRVVAAICLATLFWATAQVGEAYPDSAPVVINLTADAGQDPYQVGARVDFRAKVTCAAATSCGVVKVTVSLDPNLSYESHSVITAVREGPTTNATVQVATSANTLVFTIGTDSVGFGSGEYVVFPISARGASIPADARLKIGASAEAAGGTSATELVISTDPGPGPNDASKVSVSGCVWWDADRDAAMGATELAQSGIAVALHDVGGARLEERVTDAAGCYVFTDLDAGGSYRLAVTRPDGAAFAKAAAESVVDADGLADFTAPASGTNAATATAADLRGLNAGLVSYNLELAESLSTTGAIGPGETVHFKLVATNTGNSAALAGWQVSVVLPKKLTLISLKGSGFDCSATTCTAKAPLVAKASSATLTLTTRVADGASGELAVVSYIRPSADDVAESVPLGTTPSPETNTDGTATDNDSRTVIEVKDASDSLADTGSDGVLTELALGALLVVAGGGLLLVRRRRAAN